jgi:hypothetical protein
MPDILHCEAGDAPLRSGLRFIKRVSLSVAIAVWAAAGSFAAEQPSGVPAWLRGHIGEGEGQIAQVVLQRARAALYQQ